MRNILIALIVFLLPGCAVLNQGYVHPVTKATMECKSSGWGWIGTPMAFVMQYDCGDRMKGLGYEPK